MIAFEDEAAEDAVEDADFRVFQFERIGTALPDGLVLERLIVVDRIRSRYSAVLPDGQPVLIDIICGDGRKASASVLSELFAALKRVTVPGLTPIIDAGLTAEGEPFLVHAKPAGICLTDLLAEKHALSVPSALEIADHASAILGDLASQGFYHGMLHRAALYYIDDAEICVQIADFGLRQIIEKLALESTSSSVGAPLYMAPEQFRGAKASFQSDVYSLSAIMFEAVTGSPPQTFGGLVDIARARKYFKPPSLGEYTHSAYSESLESFFKETLEPDESKRLQNMQVVRERVRALRLQGNAEPKAGVENLSKEYRIVRTSSLEGLHGLQRIDVSQIEASELKMHRRQAQLMNIYGVIISLSVVLYGATLICLGSMHQSEKRAPLAIATDTTSGKQSVVPDRESLTAHTPKLKRGELSGDMDVSTALKFCSPYTLYADFCVGNFSAIASLDELERLSVTHTRISDFDVQALKHLPLNYLNLEDCPLIHTPTAVEMLQQPDMRLFFCTNLKFTPKDLENINPKIYELGLNGCSIDDADVAALRRLVNLSKLHISHNIATFEGLKQLKALKSLRYVNLDGNHKLQQQQLFQLIQVLPETVIHFELPGDKDFRTLAERVAHSSGLYLDASHATGDFSEILALKHLNEIEIKHSSVKEKNMRILAQLPLRCINLEECKLHGADLAAFKDHKTLRVLKLAGTQLRDEELDVLNPNLVELDLGSCRITDKGVLSLKRLAHLKELNLHNNPISEASLDIIASMSSLRMVTISGCPKLAVSVCKHFEETHPGLIVVMTKTRF